jgi:hypothetical protein
VLSSQRVAFKDVIYNAVKDKAQKEEPANPLVADGQKLIPSVTRVFSKGKEMSVYLQAYEPGTESTQPLLAFVSFYQHDEKVWETTPIKVTSNLDNRLRTLPIRFTIPLTVLAPGEYDCQISVLDATRQKAAFWRAPIAVVP